MSLVLVCLAIAAPSCGRNGAETDSLDHGSGQTVATATFKTRGKSRATKMRPRAFGEQIHLPYPRLGMATGLRGADGRPARVRCSTCHRLITPDPRNELATELSGFHQRVEIIHGDQTCRTCHNPPLFETYRLGSGRVIPYARVMELCGQCHSRERRDYLHGAHGGMTGYWDLDRGPRDRNHCIDCHNPHRPAMPRLLPAPRARYRFLDSSTQ